MNEIKYNKLVRDRIPEIIETSARSCAIEILSDEDYLRMLDAKLDEELMEYHKDQNIEELADLLEVIRAVTIARGHSLEELERVCAEKAAKRGGFEKRILLKTVVDSSEPDSLIERICMNKAAILEKISPFAHQRPGQTRGAYSLCQDEGRMRGASRENDRRGVGKD